MADRVKSFARTSRYAHNLIFSYALFITITFIRLIRFALQTCAPCAFNNAQVCDPTLSAKTKRAALAPLVVGLADKNATKPRRRVADIQLRPPVRMGASCSALRKDLFDDILRNRRSTRYRSSSLLSSHLPENLSFSGA